MVSAIYVLINMVVSNMNYDRFTSKADLYDKFRPKYSGDFIDYIYKYLKDSLNNFDSRHKKLYDILLLSDARLK